MDENGILLNVTKNSKVSRFILSRRNMGEMLRRILRSAE
jgi:hypothetical protein